MQTFLPPIQPVPPCYLLAEMEERWTGRRAHAARVRKQRHRLERALEKAGEGDGGGTVRVVPRSRRSEAMRRRWANPAFRARRLAELRVFSAAAARARRDLSPAARQAMTAHLRTPEMRARMRAGIAARGRSDAYRRHCREAQLRRLADPAYAARLAAQLQHPRMVAQRMRLVNGLMRRQPADHSGRVTVNYILAAKRRCERPEERARMAAQLQHPAMVAQRTPGRVSA